MEMESLICSMLPGSLNCWAIEWRQREELKMRVQCKRTMEYRLFSFFSSGLCYFPGGLGLRLTTYRVAAR